MTLKKFLEEKFKLTYYKNIVQKIFVFKPKFEFFVPKNNKKTKIYFETSIKNQITQLEKKFKKT